MESPKPARRTGPGTPSIANPTATGMAAVSTPVMGATIPIRPSARAR
jgi:hypothetical protein